MEFHKKLRAYMNRCRISQEVMGEIVGVSQNQVSRWQRGVNTPDIRQAALLASELGVDLNHMVDETQPLYSEAEVQLQRQVQEVIRTIGLAEAWRRLVVAGNGAMAQGVGEVAVDEAGAERRRRKGAG